MKKKIFCLSLALILASLLAHVGAREGLAKTLVFARPFLGDTMDPGTQGKIEGATSMNQVYEGLFTVEQGKILPQLSLSYQHSPDFKEWTLKLRPNVKFHDGTPFNAEAVKFNFDRMLKLKKTAYGYYLKFGKEDGIQVIDDLTVKINLNDSFSLFALDLTLSCYWIASPTYVKKNSPADDPLGTKWMTTHACGTGPYELTEWVSEQRAVFKQFNGYWGKSPKVDTIVMQVVKDPTTARLMLEKGDVDIVEKLTVEQFDELAKNPRIKVIYFPVPRITYITWDVSKPPFDDENLRKAISFAINYDEIIKFIEGGRVKRLRGLTPPGILGHPDAAVPNFDLARAKEYMAKSRYAKGVTVDLLYATERRAQFDQVVEYVQSYLKQIGVEVKPQKVAFPAQLAKMKEGGYGMSLMTWAAVEADPEDVAGWLLNSERESGGWNGSYWFDKKVLDLMKKAPTIIDTREREKVYKEVEQMAVDQAIYVYFYQVQEPFAMGQNIKNFHYDTFTYANLAMTDKE
jgi:peptide/nickel transport system substrate-binding protein